MCIFCQIANKEAPADIVFEDEEMVAFKDIKPSAPLHFLIVPKRHIQSLAEIDDQDGDLLGQILLRAKKLAEEHNIAASGYKVVINTGQDGGQIVDHLHVHLLGGGKVEKSV